ncbi:Fc.00g001470.m01.CDS01 [Cosmosporella sp. VM-42]
MVLEEGQLAMTSRFDDPNSHPSSLTAPVSSSPSTFSYGPSSTSSTFTLRPSFTCPIISENEEWPTDLQYSVLLNARELALLGYYLTYACHVLPFDHKDLYVLRVGMPNLAFNSKPIMGSLLALAAVSKCYDIVESFPAPLSSLSEIRELLLLADRHHRTSIKQMQAAIPSMKRYDCVLVHATMMVFYGCISHCVRIRLAEAAKLEVEELPVELLPAGSQWISFVRAAHTAYFKLNCNERNISEATVVKATASTASYPPRLERPAVHEDNSTSSEGGASDRTKRLLFPIVAATCSAAIEKLRVKARSLWIAEATHDSAMTAAESVDDWQQLCDYQNSELEACFAAVDILDDVATTALFAEGSTSEPSQEAVSEHGEPQRSCLPSEAPLWLRGYVTRVTSAARSTPVPRIVIAFLYRVSPEYLKVVQSILDRMPPEPSHVSVSDFASAPPSATDRLAMDIFAHWLVLYMLLNNSWGVKGVGRWELGRVLCFMKVHADDEADWWPETMFGVQKMIAEA